MVRIGLHHLETLCCIEQVGSYAAAAERLNTTQSAISSRVRELETRLKARIFRKEGRRMLLTVQGRDLVRRCEPLLHQMNEVLLSVSDLLDPSGMVSLGLGESAAMTCLPSFLNEMSVVLPKIGWNITVDVTSNLRQKLLDTELDVAVMAGPVDEAELEVVPIGHVRVSWIAASSFIDQFEGSVSLKGPVWSLPHPSYQYRVVASALKAQGIPVSHIHTCNHVHTLIEIVKSGRGVGLLSEQQVARSLASGELRCLDIEQPTQTIEFLAARRVEETDPVILRVFDEVCKMTI